MSDFSNSYREINIILDLLGDNFKKRIPSKMKDFFNTYENKMYNPQITLDDVFARKVDDNTAVLLTMMYINYWTSTKEEKDGYMELLRKKDEEFLEKHKLVIHEVFPDKDLLYEKAKETQKEMSINQNGISSNQSKGIFAGILEKIKNLFNKK